MNKDNPKKKEMTLERAWEIAEIFGKYVQEHPPPVFDYQDVLPFSKNDILDALLKILAEYDFKRMSKTAGKSEKEIKQTFCDNIRILVGSYIPTEEQHKRLIRMMKGFNGDIKE